jgi:hypothetical protein
MSQQDIEKPSQKFRQVSVKVMGPESLPKNNLFAAENAELEE